MICAHDSCAVRVRKPDRIYCGKHQRNVKNGTCSVDWCENNVNARGFCSMHLTRIRNGLPLDVPKMLRSGLIHVRRGYRFAPVRGGWKAEHRMVMEEILGRLLRPDESVHHKNGDGCDNRPENLELWSRYQPSGQRVVDKVAWAKEILMQYEPESLAKFHGRSEVVRLVAGAG